MVHSLQILLSLAIVTLIAVIIIALVRRNRFWRMVRRSLRNKIDLIYDIREQHSCLPSPGSEMRWTPWPAGRIFLLRAGCNWSGRSAPCRKSVRRCRGFGPCCNFRTRVSRKGGLGL